MVNLTTLYIVSCPGIKEPLKQSDFNFNQHFTAAMVIKNLLPIRHSICNRSRWLKKYSLAHLLKLELKNFPRYPGRHCVNYKQSPSLQLGAIFENEGTLDGTYRVREKIFKRKLWFKEYDNRIILVFGDQKTTSFCRRLKQDQAESKDNWQQKHWMLPVPALLQVELNYMEMMFRGAASVPPTDDQIHQIDQMICEITSRSPARPGQVPSVASLVRRLFP
jgi:hypothetical protein